MSGKNQPGPSGTGAFAWELTRAQGDLYVYIAALTGKAEAARDILQDANLTLCREAERYDPCRPFLPWARSVAYYEVLSWRKRQLRERLVFDDTLLEEIAAALEPAPQVPHAQLDALEGCLQKLPERMRKLFESRYVAGRTVSDLAADAGRQPNAVAASLYRIRQILSACVEDTLKGGAHADS